MGWQPSSPYAGESISTHRSEVFGNSQRQHRMASAKSLKLCCASQTASASCLSSYPLPHALCQVSRLTSAYPDKAIAHPLCGLTSLPHSLPSEELFPAQVQLQGPIFQTLSSAKFSSLNPPWRGPAFIHIFVHPCVSLPFELWRVLCVFNSLRLPFFENRSPPHHSCVCVHLGPPHTHFYIVPDCLVTK